MRLFDGEKNCAKYIAKKLSRLESAIKRTIYSHGNHQFCHLFSKQKKRKKEEEKIKLYSKMYEQTIKF